MPWGGKNKPVFRGSEYYKSVWFGKRTIKQGECAAVWGNDGQHKETEGPKLIWVLFSQVRFLERHVASQHQYLRVQGKDGRVEHIPGPIALFANPVKHESVQVMDAEVLDATEVLMLYAEQGEGVTRSEGKERATTGGGASEEGKSLITRVIRGPAVFVPSANERLLTFNWIESSDSSAKGADILKPSTEGTLHKTTRSKLSLVAHNLNISASVSTADDAHVTVRLSLRFVPQDIQKMLEASLNPIGDMIDAISADVSRVCKQVEFEALMEASHKLSTLSTYEELLRVSSSFGMSILSVLYCNHVGSSKLEQLHSSAIESRAGLKLKRDVARQEEELQEMLLDSSLKRMQREQDKETLVKTAALDHDKVKHMQALEMAEREHEQRMRHVRTERQVDLQYYESLRERAGVDITQLLLAMEASKRPQTVQKGVPEQHIRY